MKIKEWYKIAVLGFLLTICLLATYYCHFILRTEIVFTHLFYVPVILAGLWWSRKGIVVAGFLALMLLTSHIVSPLDTPINADVTRASMFMVVGTVVAILSEKMLILEDKLRAYGRILEDQVEERTFELREAQEKQRAILNGISDAVVVLDNDLNITWTNKIAMNQFGAAIGRKCFEAYHWLKEPCPECIVLKTFEDGEVRSQEQDRIQEDGNRISFIATCSPVRDGDGVIVSVVEVFHDITERKQMEEALQKSQEHLECLVKERTSELEEKNAELERMNDVFVGREFRIKELRDRVKELELKIKGRKT
ncbi:MAG: PAS domain-containing protein [Thermodesulfobacteriota bacterium]|nr:PAS domain-containing protein [Thermodesulfobacteriota bacterium]